MADKMTEGLDADDLWPKGYFDPVDDLELQPPVVTPEQERARETLREQMDEYDEQFRQLQSRLARFYHRGRCRSNWLLEATVIMELDELLVSLEERFPATKPQG